MFLNRKPSYFTTDDRLIIDFGSSFIKYGLSGEHIPRGIIRNQGSIVKLLKQIHESTMIIDEKSKEVVLSENIFITKALKDEISQLLLSKLGYGGISWVPCALLTVIAGATKHGLVIDIGSDFATVVPVYDLVPLTHYHSVGECGGAAISAILKELVLHKATISHKGIESPVKKDAEWLTNSFIETLKTQIACFTHEIDKLTTVKVTIDPSQLLFIPGCVRAEAANTIFVPNEQGICLSSMILESLQKCPIDIRSDLIQNAYLIGGTSLIPGLRSYLKESLAKYCLNSKYKDLYNTVKKISIINTPFLPNTMPFVGASVYGATKMQGFKVSPEEPISDWAFPKLEE